MQTWRVILGGIVFLGHHEPEPGTEYMSVGGDYCPVKLRQHVGTLDKSEEWGM